MQFCGAELAGPGFDHLLFGFWTYIIACWQGATALTGDLAPAFDSWLCSVVLVVRVRDGQLLRPDRVRVQLSRHDSDVICRAGAACVLVFQKARAKLSACHATSFQSKCSVQPDKRAQWLDLLLPTWFYAELCCAGRVIVVGSVIV